MSNKIIYKEYKPKTILNTQKHIDGGWFWTKYSVHPYLGCEWGCSYCYERDEKYNPYKLSTGQKARRGKNIDPAIKDLEDPFSQYIKIKVNAPELLDKALSKKERDLIYVAGYLSIERKYRIVRKMLEVCLKHNFPVFINEKSPDVLNDLDILKKISQQSYLNVGFSIITARDDKVKRVFESKSPSVASRFEAMKKLSKEGIVTGTMFMPMLPFIYDTEENIEEVIAKTKECGGQYVLDGGLTLWGYCGVYFYKVLEKYNSDLVLKYKNLYKNEQSFMEYNYKVHQLVLKYCKKYNIKNHIERNVSFYPKELQVNKKIAIPFHLKARQLQLEGGQKYKEWAYRKAAWSLEGLEEGIDKIYEREGLNGILKIKGIGQSLASVIVNDLENKK